jgi:hypothetical protein
MLEQLNPNSDVVPSSVGDPDPDPSFFHKGSERSEIMLLIIILKQLFFKQ